MMKKVIMAEFSDVRFDARVNKEAEALADMGFVVKLHMYDTSIRKSIIKREGNIEYYIHAFPARRANINWDGIIRKYLGAILILFKINLWILFHKADFYHAHNLRFLLANYIAAIIYRSKLVYDAHEIHSEHYDNSKFIGKLKNKINMYYEKLVLPKCFAFIQASEERAEFIAKKYKIQTPYVINNYVPLKNIQRNSRIRTELRLNDFPIMFYSGGVYLGGGRRLDRVIEAVSQINDLYFIIIGFMNDSVKQQLDILLNNYSLNERVFILPPKPHNELYEYASSADFGIIPLAGESINTKLSALNKISEYLMSGLPILCSDYENLKKVVYENPVGKIGITFDVKSTDSIRDSILIMIQEFQTTKMKSNAFQLAKTIYNWENEIIILKKIYLS